MVNDENKNWFENDGKANGDPADNSFGASDKEDLFDSAPAGDVSGGRANSSAPNEPSFFGRPASPASASAAPEGDYDPHARHYSSDFAERVNADANDLNKNGNIKAVRGHMLGKLLKYDYRALFKFLLPCYLVVIGASIVCCIIYAIVNGTSSSQTASRAIITFMALFNVAVTVTSVFGVIAVVSRFYKNLFSGEGYLTLSIPATPEEHLFSKLISSVSVLILTQVVVELAQLILYAPNFGMEAYLSQSQLGIILSMFENSLSALDVIEILVMGLVLEIFSVHLFYVCICLGQMVTSKNRIGAAVGFYFLFVFGGAILLSFFLVGVVFGVSDGTDSFLQLFAALGGHGTVWLIIALLALLDVGAFFLERFVLKRKVNLA